MNAALASAARDLGEGFADWQLVVFCNATACQWYHVTPFVPFGTRPTVGMRACPVCGCERFTVAAIVRGGRA